MPGYPSPDEIHLPSFSVHSGMSVGFSRTISCRRLLEKLNRGSTFSLVVMAEGAKPWAEIVDPERGKSYVSSVSGCYLNYDRDENLVVIDGLGIVLCVLIRGERSEDTGATIFRLSEKVPQSLVDTCGYVGDFVAPNYV